MRRGVGVADGATVQLRSRVGEVQVAAEVSGDMMPGVVSLPHGWGHDRDGIRLGGREPARGRSINDVIDDQRIDALTGTAVLNGTPVEVEAVRQLLLDDVLQPTSNGLNFFFFFGSLGGGRVAVGRRRRVASSSSAPPPCRPSPACRLHAHHAWSSWT